jgi:hypothetical protein
MSLSLITLVPPLYNIYNAYQDAYDRYGDKIYLNVLDPSMDSNRLKALGIRDGYAPRPVVASLVNTIVNNLNDYYNQKLFIKSEKENLKKQMRTYITIAIVLYTIISITVVLFIYFAQKYSKITDDQKRMFNTAYLWMTIGVLTIVFGFVIAIGISVRDRYDNVIDTTRKTDFDEKLNDLSALTALLDLAPSSFKTLLTQRRRVRPIVINTDFFKDKLLKFEGPYNTESQVIYYSVGKDVGASIKGEHDTFLQKICRGQLTKLPPFTNEKESKQSWKPVHMLRSIQLVDPIGQVNRINDAVTYFNGIMRKDYNPGEMLTDTMRQKIIDTIIAIFKHAGALTSNFVAHRTIDDRQDILKETVESALVCRQKCMANPQVGMSYYDSDTKVCYLLDPQNAQKTAFVYTGENSVNTNELYVKPVSCDIYLAGSKREFTDYPRLASETYKSDVSDTVLKNNQVGKIDTNNGNRLSNTSEVYESIETPVNYGNVLDGSTYTDAVQARQWRNLLAVRTDSDAILRNIISKNANFVIENRKAYLDTVVREIDRYDPAMKFQMDALAIDKILTGIFNASEPVYIDAKDKGTITDILNEVPIRRVILQERRANSNIKTGNDDTTSIHQYISSEELALNMSEMTQEDFVHKYMFYTSELFATSQGLYRLYKYYDSSQVVMSKTIKILKLLFICMLICSLILLIYNIVMELMKQQFDELSKAQRQLEKADEGSTERLTSAYMEIIIRFLLKWLSIGCIIVIVLVMLWAYKTRLANLYQYNYSVLEKNATIVRDNAKQIYQYIVDNIKQGNLVVYTGGLGMDLTVTQNTYDDLLAGISLDPDSKIVMTGVDVYDIHKKLYEAIEAFNKCNALFLGNDLNMPFPIYEVTIYGTILLMMLIVLIVIFFQLRPHQILQNLRRWNRMKIDMDNGFELKPLDPALCLDKGVTGPTADMIIQITTLALIPIVTILFATNMLSGSNNLPSALYGSALYRSNECYNL